MEPDFVQNAAFHDQLAPHYDAQLAVSPYNKLAREAFQDLVTHHVPRGSTLLDFGCGTGIDALAYARQGYQVLAYDNSPGMIEQLRFRCGREIAAGEIAPFALDYPTFLSCFVEGPAPHAVTADFAVLNSIRDLEPLFDTFARHLAHPGLVIANILNPLHWSKVMTAGWWREAVRAPRGPRLYAARPYPSYLHFVPALIKAARGFRLEGRANAGAVVRYDSPFLQPVWWTAEGAARGRSSRFLWNTPAYKLLGHFIFLVFRRDG